MNPFVPGEITDPLTFFENRVKKEFRFLSDFGFTPGESTTGKNPAFLYNYVQLSYVNNPLTIHFYFTTDHIRGHKSKFQESAPPVYNSVIVISISDGTHYLSLQDYFTHQQLASKENLMIPIDAKECPEIARVLNVYSTLCRTALTDVLKKEVMYDCHFDHYGDFVFQKIILSNTRF